MENLAVLITPSFQAPAWYEKDAAHNRLMIFAILPNSMSSARESTLEASYRLTANRFDWKKWSNNASDDSWEGFVIKEK